MSGVSVELEDHIPLTQERSLVVSRQTSIWLLLDVVFYENTSNGVKKMKACTEG